MKSPHNIPSQTAWFEITDLNKYNYKNTFLSVLYTWEICFDSFIISVLPYNQNAKTVGKSCRIPIKAEFHGFEIISSVKEALKEVWRQHMRDMWKFWKFDVDNIFQQKFERVWNSKKKVVLKKHLRELLSTNYVNF